MSSLKDQIIERLKEEIIEELDSEFTQDLKNRLKTQIRNEVEDDIEFDDYEAARVAIAQEVYEAEFDKIRDDVTEKIWENYDPILDYTARALREFKVGMRDEIEDMVADLKVSILSDLKDNLRTFVETELESYWTAEMRQILRDELSGQLFD